MPEPARTLALPPPDPDDLPAPVKALPPLRQRAWLALAEGANFREAAARAGTTTQHVWRWARDEPFRSLLATRFLPLADDADAAVAARLSEGLAEGANDNAKERSLRAAMHVHRGLGIGVTGASAAPARVDVSVRVAVSLDGVLRAPASLVIDVPADALGDDDADDLVSLPALATVASEAPARSQTSARRPQRPPDP